MTTRETLTHRKASFKTPPSLVGENGQHSRRVAAIAAQQRARSERQNAHRTDIERFQALSLGGDSDDEEVTIDRSEGVAKYVQTMQPAAGGSSSVRKRKPSRWANFCMYAELLEFTDDDAMELSVTGPSDGIPADLQDNWIAVGPLPAGKRCLAVSTQANGTGGIMSKTSLKSRLKGHTLLTFPSTLPANTILDCILDARWQENGLLHILDVVRWRGMEFDDCSADMRLWWRDVRLSEIGQLNPASAAAAEPGRTFQFPVFFAPVPFTDKPTYETFLTQIIPQCRTKRNVSISVPSASHGEDCMELDHATLDTVEVALDPDGILLYVREACYESGTSPLCVWIPSKPLDPTNDTQNPLDVFERLLYKRTASK